MRHIGAIAGDLVCHGCLGRAVLALFVALVTAPAWAQSSPADLLNSAESAFDKAESRLATDPPAAKAGLDEAIAAYRALIDTGVENAAIHRNIGTAYMLEGDLGRAIAAFRRAERLDPTDHRVEESLAAARAKVRTEVSPGTRSRVEDAILFWRGRVSRDTMLAIGLAGWALAWIGAAIRMRSQRGATLIAAGALVAVLTLGSLVAERTLTTMNPSAVIVQDGVMGYRGPSESVYDATFEQPIRAGVEGSILERRDGWTRLRLRSGAETWVRSDSLETV
ncbi:MAG: tetratricopeptide repeat protein [Phycisphaeraceae bacterium]|nr:MAG: tetratricopeptide repeat protein [Phycisphaeraceae bacterium]